MDPLHVVIDVPQNFALQICPNLQAEVTFAEQGLEILGEFDAPGDLRGFAG